MISPKYYKLKFHSLVKITQNIKNALNKYVFKPSLRRCWTRFISRSPEEDINSQVDFVVN